MCVFEDTSAAPFLVDNCYYIGRRNVGKNLLSERHFTQTSDRFQERKRRGGNCKNAFLSLGLCGKFPLNQNFVLSMFMVGALLRFGSIAAWVFHIIACMGGCLGCDTKPKLISSLGEPFKGQNKNAWKTSKATLSEDFWTTSTCEMDNSAVQSCGSISSTNTLTQVHDALGAGCSSKPSEFVNHGCGCVVVLVVCLGSLLTVKFTVLVSKGRTKNKIRIKICWCSFFSLDHALIYSPCNFHSFILFSLPPHASYILWIMDKCILSGEALAVGLILWNQSRKKWIGNKKPESRAQQHREPKLSWNATYDSLLSNNKPFHKPVPLGEMIDFLVDIWEQEGMYD
ncbi:hypothetical protein Pfo_020068 [Paulownia fortunei]|nr:hypothetical protein Pfo_020068 [Paulownia fortunei]